MTDETEDPRLTAYALGELDPAERPAVEELLARDPAARRTVDEIQATAASLAMELDRERVLDLSFDRKQAIEAAIAAPAVSGAPAGIRRGMWGSWKTLAGAACVMLAAGTTAWFLVGKQTAEHEAPSSKVAVSSDMRPKLEPSHDTPMSSSDIVVPPDVLRQAELGDHFESKSLDGTKPEPPKIGRAPTLHMLAPSAESAATPPPPVAPAIVPNPKSAAPKIYSGSVRKEKEDRRLPSPKLPSPKKEEGRDLKVTSLPVAEPEPGEAFDAINDNPFLAVVQPGNALSTFSVDVDTASYSIARRYLTANARPPKDSVRIEEMLNYFTYDYSPPTADSEDPFASHVEIAPCPWNAEHRLVRIGLKGKEIAQNVRPPSNLVFLVDVSGSMNDKNRLPLVQSSLKALVTRLGDRDRVSLVVYAGAAGLVLPSTPCNKRAEINAAIDNLQAGGSTNGGQGIHLAYDIAKQNFITKGTNRVILATDGDFNVGVSSPGELVRVIEEKAKTGVFLSVLGFGMGNYKDGNLEKLADKGNGNYAYIDTFAEAQKVLATQMSGTLVTIAKDVKIQVEFNPAMVREYRLIGYENRMLAAQDFEDDKKDAGEIGAGHTVTALYEIVPAGAPGNAKVPPPLKYQGVPSPTDIAFDGEWLTLKLRYKQPDGETSKELVFPVKDAAESLDGATSDFKFAAAVAAFGMILRGSSHAGTATLDDVLRWAEENRGLDEHGFRAEFIRLVGKAKLVK